MTGELEVYVIPDGKTLEKNNDYIVWSKLNGDGAVSKKNVA